MTRIAAQLMWAFVLAVGVVVPLGCRGWGSVSPDEEPIVNMPQTTPDPVTIVYRTKTDRLILAGADLPPYSMATLLVKFPHPYVKADFAQMRLTTVPCSADDELSPTDLAQSLASAEQEHVGELPAWQVHATVDALEKANFYRRAKILGAETFLSLTTANRKLGKPYRAVPELDAIIVRLAQSSGASEIHSDHPELARLPALPPQ